ncbi:MAG: FkbM family methyltransferase, partial [Rhodospirillales bacterium]|nr:FkbM family methyltransferase [Rhodospirillales bacterium]
EQTESLPDLLDGLLQHLVALRARPMQAAPASNGAPLEALIERHQAALSARLDELLRLQRETHWLLPSHLWTPETGEQVRRVLSLLHPFRLANATKIRVGRPNDGGYVMVDDIAGIRTALSLGINDDVSWDLGMATRQIRVRQFDHTVDGPPEPHPAFEFHKRRITPTDDGNGVSIATLLRQCRSEGDQAILKIDIEGDEWPCLAALDPTLLDVCPQVLCEFHNLHRLAEPAFAETAARVFRAFGERFFVCHVHANNCGDVYNIGNVPVPDTLEITFANRSRYQPLDVMEVFPTPLDMPNQRGRADIFLGAFRFGP